MGKVAGLLWILAASMAAGADTSGRRATAKAARSVLDRILAEHPKVKVLRWTELDVAAATAELRRSDPESRATSAYGFTLRAAIHGDDVSELTRFRNNLKGHARLKALLPILIVHVEWKVGGGGTDPAEDVEFAMTFLR